MLAEGGGSLPMHPIPPAPQFRPPAHTRVRLWGSILWNIIWLRLRRGAAGEPGGWGQPFRTISRLDFSEGGDLP